MSTTRKIDILSCRQPDRFCWVWTFSIRVSLSSTEISAILVPLSVLWFGEERVEVDRVSNLWQGIPVKVDTLQEIHSEKENKVFRVFKLYIFAWFWCYLYFVITFVFTRHCVLLCCSLWVKAFSKP